VAGGQKDTASGFAYPDDVTGCGCAENTVLADQELLDTVSGTNLGDQLSDLGVPVTTVTTDNEGWARYALGDGEQDAGNEGLWVVVLLEDLDLLAETRTVEWMN
jgi:hypothetical protein